MKTVNFIVEGTKDVYFLHEFLLQRFPMFDRDENPIPERRLKGNAVNLISSDKRFAVHIQGLEGFSEVANLPNLFRPAPGIEGDFAWGIVFDADHVVGGDHGGPEARREYLLDLLKVPPAQRDRVSEAIFLFPDNQSEGDLETLLEGMVPPTPEHEAFLEVCWKGFSACVGRHEFNPTSQKSKMNEYAAAFHDGTWRNNGINLGFRVGHLWNWRCHALTALTEFAGKVLQENVDT